MSLKKLKARVTVGFGRLNSGVSPIHDCLTLLKMRAVLLSQRQGLFNAEGEKGKGLVSRLDSLVEKLDRGPSFRSLRAG